MSNRDFPQTPLRAPPRGDAQRSETLRPVANDPFPIDDTAYVKPVRWPLIIAIALLTLSAFVGVIVIATRTTGLSGVNATLAAAAQRNETERVSQGAAPALVSASNMAAVERAVEKAMGPALQACGLTAPQEPVRADLTVASRGVVTGVSMQSAPFARTRAGECLSQQLVGLPVPGYDGADGRVLVSARARLALRAGSSPASQAPNAASGRAVWDR